MTVKKLIKRSMRKAGVLAAGETPSADEVNDALDTLNDIITDWSSTGRGLISRPELIIPIVSGVSTYYIGLTAPDNTESVVAERPEIVEGGMWREGNMLTAVEVFWDDTGTWDDTDVWVDGDIKSGSDIDVPLEWISLQEYDAIPDKTSTGTPSKITYEATVPAGKIHLWPVPNLIGAIKLRVAAAPESEITNVNTAISSIFPKSVASSLKWVLAAELCPEYGIPIPAFVFSMAKSSRRNIENVILARTMVTRKIASPSGVNIYNI